MLSETTEKEILYDLIYTWNLKNQTQTDQNGGWGSEYEGKMGEEGETV